MRFARSSASLLAAAAIALAADAVKLAALHKEGEVRVDRTTFEAKLQGKVEAQPGQKVDLTLVMSQSEETRDEVLAVKEGRVTKVKRTFARKEYAVDQLVGGQSMGKQSGNAPLHGKSATIAADGAATKVEEKFEGVEEMDADDRRLEPAWNELLPDRDVAPGESWTLSREKLDRHFGSDSFREGSVKCTFESVVEEGGVRSGRILVEMDVKLLFDGTPGSLKAAGPVLWDIAGGFARSATLEGTMTVDDPDMGSVSGPFKAVTQITREK
jgi:hypothetical protein